MSIGIIAFHVTMLPEGTAIAAVMLLLNVGAAYDPDRIQELVRA